MPKQSDDTPRKFIDQAYSADLFARLSEILTNELHAHYRQVMNRQSPVLQWGEPAATVLHAATWLQQADINPADSSDSHACQNRFRTLVQETLRHGQNLHHPRYIGHQVPAAMPLAALFDMIGSATNQVMAIYEMGPWATAVERATIDHLGHALGLQPGFGGVVTHGGSLANLTALATARNRALGSVWQDGLAAQTSPPVLLAHADSHYCIRRAAGILGIGERQVLSVPLDESRRMNPAALDSMLREAKQAGIPVIAVCASACATPIGAFDPLVDIADICERHQVWLHVDAAHGGAAALSPRYRHLVQGLARADSFVCDAHKMMFVPALCAFVFYRRGEDRFAAFDQEAPYLFDPSAPDLAEYDSGRATLECTKRAATFGLWGMWSLFGQGLFTELVDSTFNLGSILFEMLSQEPDFIPLHRPQCNIVAFRHVPPVAADWDEDGLSEFQFRLRRRVIESGDGYLVPCIIDGRGALRMTIMNPLTTENDLREMLQIIRRHASALLETKFVGE